LVAGLATVAGCERIVTELSCEELTAKYMMDRGVGFGVQDHPPTLEQAAIIAEAEQIERMMRDLRQACEDYNGPELMWLTWELPAELRERIDGVQTRLREAQARDSRDGGGIVFYQDDRNKYDEADGWPAYDPDNPHHQTVPMGVVVAEPNLTVHVLRGGTGERVTTPIPRRHQSFADEARELGLDDLPDYGPGYDFAEFMERADYRSMFRHCDMGMAKGCKIGIGGGKTRLIAVPTGRYVFVLTVCRSCLTALAGSQSRAHPNWRVPPFTFPANRTSNRWWLARRR
jgi:hypothetical protein